jgi:hypothetical protein
MKRPAACAAKNGVQPSCTPYGLALTLAVLAAGGLAQAGCSSDPTMGYSTRSMYRENISTVAVPIWTRGSAVYRRDVERRLTEAIIKRLELDTPYKVVDKSKADTLLEGELTGYGQRVMSFDPATGNPRDIEVTLFVNFSWTDLRTGEILVHKEKFRATGVYYPTAPFAEDPYLGAEDALDQLSRRIVESLEKPW